MKTIGLKTLLTLTAAIILMIAGTKSTLGQGDNVPENCLKNYSLYYEFFKHKNYKDALNPWRKLYNECPEWKESTFAYGVTIYKYMLENTTDPAEIAAYSDTIMLIYDQRIDYFPEKKGDILGRKGVDLLRYRRNDGAEFIKQGYEILSESIEIDGNEASPVVLTTQISAGISLYLNDMLDGEKVITDYVTASNILDAQLAKRPSSKTKMAKDAIEENIRDSKVMTCESIVTFFGPKFEANKEDVAFLNLILGFMNDAGDCEMTSLYANASEQLYSIQPDAEAAYNLGRLFLRKEEFQKTKEYYLEAISLAENDEYKARYNFSLAGLVQQYLNSPAEAVKYAYAATQLDPDWGDPYILMGIAYVSGNSALGDEFERRTAYWVAVDQFRKARQVDASVADKASELINEYEAYFPTKEDLFFRSIAEGDSYTVGGWINKTTSARPKN